MMQPGRIELIPGQPVPRGSRMRMVVVVPAFAEGHQSDPPVVARIVARANRRVPHIWVAEFTSQVACSRPRLAGKPPHKTIGRPPTRKERPPSTTVRHPVIVVQPDIEIVLRQIGRVLAHQPRVVVLGFAEQNPADVRPARAVTRRVRIARLVGFLMVNPVRRHPENRAALERQGAQTAKRYSSHSGT